MNRSWWFVLAGMLLLAACTGTRQSTEERAGDVKRAKRPYLLSVTFFTRVLAENTPERMKLISDSPYDGVAQPIIGSYDGSPIPAEETVWPAFKRMKDASGKHLWPWIFTNRLCAQAEDGSTILGKRTKHRHPYFPRIKAVDLDDEAGARTDFYKLWRMALRLAKRSGAPGIVVDPWMYNDGRCEVVGHIAKTRGESVEQVVAQLHGIGADLGQMVAEEYPEAIIWIMFTELHRSGVKRSRGKPKLYTVSCITLGLLDYLKEHHVPGKVVDGGAYTLWYYNPDADRLQKKITRAQSRLAWLTDKCPDHFAIGGTIAPYHDITKLKPGRWIAKDAKDNPKLRTIDDFRPLFRLLFQTYPYVWIYAASAARYDPYDPQIAPHYNRVLEEVLGEFR